ncbi:MAG TPA: NUDIX domain-containing protein [Mycobacteriales bacterium]|jgi:8-oxo-dGTP pyrophosphatase MutT (NUDIX family)|nr:NUDIX domain-containing protein [Mycobacteriales bacterium]
MAELLERTAGRVIVLDPAGRVLLFEGIDPGLQDGPRFWFTPGGGCEPGESIEAAARRELVEETGLRPIELHGPVLERRAEFEFDGGLLRQYEQFFVARVAADELGIVNEGFTDLERRSILGHRWWGVAELRSSGVEVYPEQLPDLVERLVAEVPC